MPPESPTKWQAQAYRFGVRRLESAVASGDALLRGDPLRRRLNVALIISVILAALLLGVFAILGLVRPDPTIGSAAVVVDKDTGAVYVNRNGTLYPAMNLASALLAAGTGMSSGAGSASGAPSRTSVGSDVIAKQPRGPRLGIPGAPGNLPTHLDPPQWTICDTTTADPGRPPSTPPTVATTAIVGRPRPAGGGLGADALLVRAPGDSTTYLLFSGLRAPIDPNSGPVRLAFGLGSNTAPRPISAALLGTIPLSAPIAPPAIQGTVGDQTTYGGLGVGITVGEVFRLVRADGSSQIYVAMRDGVDKITPLLGDLIRDANSERAEPPAVSPRALAAAPRVDLLDTGAFPTMRPDLIGVGSDPTVCVTRSGKSTAAQLYRFRGLPLPVGAKPVPVTTTVPNGVQSVYVQPGHGAVFASTQSTQGPGPDRPLFLITDDGVAFPIVGQDALVDLGYSNGAVAATAPGLIDLLPRGPALDPAAAARFYPQTGSVPQTGPGVGSLPPATTAAG